MRVRDGTFRNFSEKHFDCYAGEFSGWHNNWSADTFARIAAAFAGTVGKRLRYADSVA